MVSFFSTQKVSIMITNEKLMVDLRKITGSAGTAAPVSFAWSE